MGARDGLKAFLRLALNATRPLAGRRRALILMRCWLLAAVGMPAVRRSGVIVLLVIGVVNDSDDRR